MRRSVGMREKLKDGGYDIVRLPHYPQAPAFLDACDELGLMTHRLHPRLAALQRHAPVQKQCLQDFRQTIRRDRNHPCAVLWETSLNETMGHDDILRQLIEAAHEEYPGDQMLTCGDTEGHDLQDA